MYEQLSAIVVVCFILKLRYDRDMGYDTLTERIVYTESMKFRLHASRWPTRTRIREVNILHVLVL